MAIHGSKAVFKLANNASTLTDISAYLRDVKIDQDVKVVFRAVPGLAETYEIGQSSGVIALEGAMNPAIVTQLQGMWDSNAHRDLLYNWEYGPEGTAVGSVKLTGTCRLSMFHLGSAITDANEWKATLQITNNVVTVGVY